MYDTINIKKARQECLRYRQKRFAFWFDTRHDFCRAFFVLIDRKMLVTWREANKNCFSNSCKALALLFYIVTELHNLHSQMLSLNMQFLEECFRALVFRMVNDIFRFAVFNDQTAIHKDDTI